jgi:hypothetical protein
VPGHERDRKCGGRRRCGDGMTHYSPPVRDRATLPRERDCNASQMCRPQDHSGASRARRR